MSSLNKGGRCTRNRRRQHSMLTVVTTTAAVGQRNNNQNLSTIMSRDEHQILSSTTNQDLEHNNRGHMSKRPKLKTIDCRRTVTASSLKISSPLSRSGFEISNQQVRATSSSPALREGVFTSTQNQCHKNHKWDTSYHNDTNTLLPTDHQNLRQYICVTSPFSNNNNNNLDSADKIATVDSVHQKQSRKRSPSTRPGRKHLTTLPQDIISATTHFLCVKDLVALCSTCRNCRTTLTTGPVMINMREIGTFPESNHLNKYVFTPKHQHTLDAMEQNTRSVIAQHRTCLNHMEKLCGLFQNACGLRLVHSKVAHDYRVSKHITQMLSHSLVSINFSGSLFVDERAFRRILTNCGRLQNLNLKGCRRVDGASIILKPRTTVFNALKSLHWLMVAGTSFSTMAVDALRRIIETIPASPQARRQRIYRRSLRGMRCCPNRQETANGVQTLSCAPFSSCTCASIHICISRTPALRQFMTTYLPDVVKGMKELVTLPYPEQQSENTINVARCPNTSVDQTPVTTAESELNTVFGVQTETSTQSLVGGVSAMDLSRQSTDRKEEQKQEKTLCWQVKYCFTRVQQLLLQFQMNLSALDSQLLSEYQRVNGATAANKQTKIRIGSNLVPFKQFDSIRTMVDILQTDGRNTMIDAPLNAFHASALMFASLTGKRHAVEALVRQGADIEAATNAPNGPPSRASTLTQYLESIEEKEQDEPLIGDDSHIPFHRDFLVEQGFIKDLDSEMGDTDHLDEFEQESAEQAHVWHATNNDREDGGATALYAASHRGHEGIVDMLIRHGADVGAVRDSGVSSLYVAAQEGHLSVLKRLLKAGAYVECRRMDGTTPLFIAAQEGNLEIVRNLLAAGADPNLANHEGVTGLCSAARWGHEGVVRLLLEHGAIPTYRDCSGATPLYCAAQEGHLGIVSVLLQHGARVDETGKDGATPLFVASSRGHREIVSLLLKSGSNPSHAMADGTTPIFIASQMGHRDIIAMICNARLRVPQLRDVKVDVNAPRSDAVTPLLIATAAGHTMCVRLLLAMGANPDILTDDGTSPLYLAAQEGNLGLVTALVEFGASTQLKDETGATALHIASHAGHVKVVQALLNAGGDPLAETAGGYIPLHYSIQAGHKQVSRELLAVPYAPHRQIQILHGMRQIQLDTGNAHRHAEEETGLI